MSAAIEPIIGRYLTTEIAGQRCRIYFEEAGQGIPLVCLHTAGADLHDVAGAQHVVGDCLDNVLFHQRHVFVGSGVENVIGTVFFEDLT